MRYSNFADLLLVALKRGQGLLLLWLSVLFFSQTVIAQEQFLPSDQAFAFEASSVSDNTIELNWNIAEHYYLYKHQFAVSVNGQPITLTLPTASPKHDEYFGDTEVYYQKISFEITAQPDKIYEVTYQGCAEAGLCYPISKTEFSTDQDALVVRSDTSLFSKQQPSLLTTAQNNTTNTEQNSVETPKPQSVDVAQDQQWSSRLHEQSFILSVLVFLGLGCLLAFTPCSLPMLPILSSLLIRKHAGVKAGLISIVFVLAMAFVYALLGVAAASAGSNFQRWLQQPAILIGFSTIFILFALNLFGAFEIKLPQALANRLDRLQSKQKGGTLVSAALMGMLSALLVGPCMTAPLAGTLLYISQTQNMVIGASLLFALGLGMGLPLVLLSLIGQKAIPKPGQWMNYVRHIFAFIMLGLSLYFIRPLISIEIFNACLLVIAVALAGYLIWLMRKEQGWIRNAALVLFIGVTIGSLWKGVQYWQYQTRTSTIWQVVTTKQEFDEALAQARMQSQPVVVDLYADWCIACQPIEREIWTDPEVQQQLATRVKIKVDLSRYDSSQQQLLNEWAMLGPPTVLFLDQFTEENRALRLTGNFTKSDLLSHLATDQ